MWASARREQFPPNALPCFHRLTGFALWRATRQPEPFRNERQTRLLALPRCAQARAETQIDPCLPEFRREFEKWLVRRIINSQQWPSSLPHFLAQRQSPAPRGSMSDEDAVGEGSHEAVSGVGKGNRDPIMLWFEGREDRQTAGGEGGLKLLLQVHADDAPGRNPDHRLPATQ